MLTAKPWLKYANIRLFPPEIVLCHQQGKTTQRYGPLELLQTCLFVSDTFVDDFWREVIFHCCNVTGVIHRDVILSS